MKIGIIIGGSPEEREIIRNLARTISRILTKGGKFAPINLDLDRDIRDNLIKYQIDLAFILDSIFIDTNTDRSPALGNKNIRQILEELKIPYTGSREIGAKRARNKIVSKIAFKKAGLPTAKFIPISLTWGIRKQFDKIRRELGLPFILKPRDEGTSVGVTLCKNHKEFTKSVFRLRKKFGHLFAEQYICGREITVPILEVAGLPVPLEVIEIVHNKPIYSFKIKEKYRGRTDIYIAPAHLDKFLYQYVAQVAVAAHRAVGCNGYSRVDMIIDRDDSAQILEINALPLISTWPILIKGISLNQILEQIIENALKSKPYVS